MQLDSQQTKAVLTNSNKALVLSGAGSGKTRVLIERIAHLIEDKKVSPYEICAFSFTRKASGEIRYRLEERIGTQANKCTLGTMHGIALQMIHRFGELIGLRNNQVTVYCEWESDYLLREVAIDLALYKKGKWTIPKKKVIDPIFANYYEKGEEPDERNPAYGLFRSFISRCNENNALTYGALLIGLEMLIPHLAKYLQWKHILVDEVQDIDPLQWRIINKMCRAFGASLFVVGDIDQSVYSFRGAVPEYLIDHQHEFDIFKIETNYRSDANIVNAANSLIEHNQDRLPKTMRPFEDAQTEIRLPKNVDSAKLVVLINELNEISPDVKRAVLARNHVLLKKLSQLLTEADFDHVYIGKQTALTNSEEFRRFHAFLKLIVNPYDNFAFLLIKELIGVSREKYSTIRLKAVQEGQSHFQAWYAGVENKWTEFYTANDEGIWTLVQSATVLASFFGEGDLNKLVDNSSLQFINEWAENNPNGTIQEYLNWLATYDIQDEIAEESEVLQLMTIHAAKGLEWNTVILAGVNEGLLPSKQALKNNELASERRLCYVAITRARDTLIITVRPETKTSESGKVYHNPISRFVEEMNGSHA